MRQGAAELGIELVALPGDSPNFMPVEALWRWLREDVTDHHCHASANDLIPFPGDQIPGTGWDPRATWRLAASSHPQAV